MFTGKLGRKPQHRALRPDLPEQRDPPPPHRSVLAHHYRQDRAAAQDDAQELFAPAAFASIEQAQAELDRWVTHYNLSREHAVSVTTKGFNIHTVGVILLAVGIAAFIIGLLFVVAGGTRRATMREDIRNTPGGQERVAEERDNLAP